MSAVIQRSLASGEISPSLYARVDATRYATGLRTMRNAWTRKDGGSQNRPGNDFVSEAVNSDGPCRLIPFVFSDDQSYAIELSDQFFRVYQDGKPCVKVQNGPALTITNSSTCTIGVTNATTFDDLVSSFGTTEIYITSAKGMTELNGRVFVVSDVDLIGNTFKIKDINGSYIDSSLYGTYIASSATISFVVSGSLPYIEDDLFDIQYAQSGDVLTLTHPNYPVYEIRRIDDPTFVGSAFFFKSIATLGGEVSNAPMSWSLTTIPTGSLAARYCVTGVLANGTETSPLVRTPGVQITGATKASPCVITVTSTTGIVTGDLVYIAGVKGMTELNGKYFYVTTLSGTTLGLNIDSATFGTFSASAGTPTEYCQLCSAYTAAVATPTVAAPLIITGFRSSTANLTQTVYSTSFASGNLVAWNVYREIYGIFGYIGTTRDYGFTDTGLTADPSVNPPDVKAFLDHSPILYAEHPNLTDIPACVAFCNQRLVFGNFTTNTEKIVASRVGDYHAYSSENPIIASDMVSFTIAGNKVSSVRHIVDLGKMLIFTQSGEFSAEGDNGVVTPSQINLKRHSGFGANRLSPIVINGSALFVQARGSVVRDFMYDFNIDGYRGDDLTIFSSHLFENHTIVDWCYQQTPNSIVWAVRDDGILIGITYVREQQIVACHHHDFTNGIVESVCAVPEGQEDAVYMVVKRVINGTTKRYIERLHTRVIDDIVDAVFVDSAQTYDGRNTDATKTMTISGSGWTSNDTLTLTSNAAFFTASDVGNEIHLDLIDDVTTSETFGEVISQIRFSIKAYSSSTVVTGKPQKTVPATMQAIANSNWSKAIKVISSLGHLEGEKVSVFADGNVVASPNNDQYESVTVTNGIATLDKCYSVITIGLPITSDIETLNIDTVNGETISDKYKNVSGVTLFLDKTRGGWVGPKPPSDEFEDYHGGLIEFKPRNSEPYDDPSTLKTGSFDLNILSEWNSNGRIFIRQSDPLPMSILAIAAAGNFPFRGG